LKLFARFLSFSVLLGACSPLIAGARARTPILSEFNTILTIAHESVLRGDYRQARALTGLVLMDRLIRVQMSTDAATLPRRAECVRALRDGIARWEQALGGAVRFAFISDPNRAEIRVRFSESLAQIDANAAGHCDYVREIVNGQPRTTAKLSVLTRTPSGEPMSHELMRHTVMHEVGHVLGLEDSQEVGAVMGPLDLANPVSEISPIEIEELLWARSEARQLAQRVDARIYARR
jgi:hypothetical protein